MIGVKTGLSPRLRLAACLCWQLPQQTLVAVVRAYRFLLKPWLGNACRFEPTCSAYTLQALLDQGAVRGAALGTWRLMRCHPWCQGGFDPVPPKSSKPVAGLFTRLGLKSGQPHPPTLTPP